MTEMDALPYEAPEPHARERNRRVISSVLSALLLKPLSLLAPLITAPLFVRYLDKERFGLFEAIISMSALLAISNAGLTLGLVNRLMDCNISGDRDLARRYVSSLMITLTGIIAVAVLIWTGISALVPWQHVFKTDDPGTLHEIPWIVWITGVATLVGLIFSMPTAICAAYQELTILNLWDAAAKALTFAASVAVVYTSFGLIGVAVASTAVQTVVWGTNTIWIFHRRPWIRPSFRSFDLKLVRATVADGFLLLVLQVSVIALFQCDKLIIGTAVRPEAVTQYALLGKIFMSVYGLFMVLLSPLWPAHGEAVRRGDWPWIRRGLRLSLVAGIGLSAGCGLVLLLFGNAIFRRWMPGQHFTVSSNLVLALTATLVLRAWVDCRSVILISANVLMPQVILFGGHALLNLAVALILVRPFGVAGVAWATPLTALMTTAWGYPWMLRRLSQKPSPLAVAAA